TGGEGRDTFAFGGSNIDDDIDTDATDAQEDLEANLVTITDFGNGRDILNLEGYELDDGFAEQDVVDLFVENFLVENEGAELVDLVDALQDKDYGAAKF